METRKFTIPLKAEPNDEWETLDRASQQTGIPKTTLTKNALKKELWREHGILWPRYQPEECHYCERPMSDHTFISSSATEPGAYECPGDDEVGI